MSVQMELSKIIISEMQDQQIIVLKEVDGDRKFPIVIGSGEAYAIDRRLKGILHPRPLTHDLLAAVITQACGATHASALYRRLKGILRPRPLTHDLLAAVIEQLGGAIEPIEINTLQDHTFLARI